MVFFQSQYRLLMPPYGALLSTSIWSASGAAAFLLLAVVFNAAISQAVPWPLLDATIPLTQEPITPIPPGAGG